MLGSLKIARMFGIDVRLHWTFALVLILVVAAAGSAGIAPLMLLFGSVLLHELGHSLVAKHFGVEVLDITFWPLGGMARMTDIPEEPRIEGLIAIAGPAVNFVLIALCLTVLFGFLLAEWRGPIYDAVAAGLVVNAMLGVFNLVPAFPMDGGRLLRAFLARKQDYVRATENAVRAGRIVALGMLVLSLAASFVSGQFCIVPLIAIFIWYAGGRELMSVRLRHGMSAFGQRAPRPAYARAEPPAAPQRDVDPGGARRPDAWEPGLPGGGGFTEELIRDLERYPGRLRRPARGSEHDDSP